MQKETHERRGISHLGGRACPGWKSLLGRDWCRPGWDGEALWSEKKIVPRRLRFFAKPVEFFTSH